MTKAVFLARFDSLASIAHFVREAAARAGLDERAVYQVETAVDEACSNIIEHAYANCNDGQIECECRIEPDRLLISLSDTGLPFDPAGVGTPDTTASIEERESHGLGLFFMRQWMDDVIFSRSANCNTVTMTKLRGKKS